MSFDELRALLAIAEQGSFLGAAVALNTSRTTLRRQVDVLEARAGVPLIVRNSKGIVLTAAGEEFARQARNMQREFDALLTMVREMGREPAGELRVLLQVGLQPTVLAACFQLFRRSWPGVYITVRYAEAPL